MKYDNVGRYIFLKLKDEKEEMKMGKLYGSIVILVIAIFLSSCTYRIADLTLASTKNVQIGQTYEKVSSQVMGSDKKPIVVIIPLGYPSIEEAIDQALNRVGGDLMTNVVIYYKYFYIPYIYGEIEFEIKGDVWKKKSQSIGRIDKDKINTARKIFKAVKENGEIKLVEVTKDEVL